jgi:hypothetical protein
MILAKTNDQPVMPDDFQSERRVRNRHGQECSVDLAGDDLLFQLKSFTMRRPYRATGNNSSMNLTSCVKQTAIHAWGTAKFQ